MSNCGKVDHCCWFQGNICKYLKESDHPDFKWACSLKETYGSWEAAYASDEYIRDVKHKVNAVSPGGLDCGDWPFNRVCNTCGEKG
tara:strand:- start:71 stop:328 length:258 start_codon:yes stop_codon:yes gene_type:complete